ncbi:MAG: DUF4349 domain-containing protein [Clostridia bacterium]|nr:DUF4349 domain-containing protein [Clostridia bacterium]
MKSALILLFTLLLTLTSCGSAPYDKATDEMYRGEMNTYTSSENGSFGFLTGTSSDVMEDAEMEEVKDAYYSSSDPAAGTEPASAAENRKLIREAYLNMETKEYDTMLSSLEKQVAEAGGYVQSAQTEGNPEYSNRWMHYVLRIPESRYEQFLENVNTLGTVTSRNENVTDITLHYTDTESRIKALETEYATLLTILEKCDTLNDVITVQSRITEVTYQLENYKSTLRTYDNQVSYCTVQLTVREVQKITESEKNLTTGERMGRDILNNWSDLADDALDFVVWFVSALPALIVWGVIVTVIVLLIRRSVNKRKMRKNTMVSGMMYDVQSAPAMPENDHAENKK